MNQEEEKTPDEMDPVGIDLDDTPRGTIELLDESYIATLSSLWELPGIARNYSGSGSGSLKTFVRDLMKILSKYVVAAHGPQNPLPTMMLVYHGDTPSDERAFTPKELLWAIADKANYSVWTLSEASEYEIVGLTKTAGADHWPKNLSIMVSDLDAPSFITNDGAHAIDELMTRTFTALEADHAVRGQRAFGSGLSSSSASSSRPPSVANTRHASPMGTRSASMERELAAERTRAAAIENDNAALREQLRVMAATGVGGQTPLPAPAPAPAPAPLTQLPFNPALLATDPAFIAAMAAAFRNSGGGGGGSGTAYGGMVPGLPPTWPATVVNVSSTQSETKRQNLYRVNRIVGLFEPGKFELVWKPLDIDSTGEPSSYNMEYSQDYIRGLLMTKRGRNAREPTSKFLLNASLFLFDTAEGLALEHFLGPKEAIGGDWDEFAKAWTIMTNLYGEYFGETLAAALRKYWFELFELHHEFENLAVEALVHLAQRTLGKLRLVGDRSQRDAARYIRNVLCVDRADQEIIDMLHREQFSGRGRGTKRGKHERGRLTHPADLDALDDTDSDGTVVPGKKAKAKGQARPPAPRLLGPPPCYLWVAGKCQGAACTQPPTRTNKGPHPHGWDKRDKGTPAQADFTAWVKKFF